MVHFSAFQIKSNGNKLYLTNRENLAYSELDNFMLTTKHDRVLVVSSQGKAVVYNRVNNELIATNKFIMEQPELIP